MSFINFELKGVVMLYQEIKDKKFSYSFLLYGFIAFVLIHFLSSTAFAKDKITVPQTDSGNYDGWHNVGLDCMSCHNTNKPMFLAGTLYSSRDGGAPVEGALITATFANGRTITLSSSASGNFSIRTKNIVGQITMPYSITITKDNMSMSMVTQPTSGSCNSSGCHSSDSAAGRVYLSDQPVVTTPTPTTAYYDPDVSSIMTNKCIICHQAGGAFASAPLTTYSELSTYVSAGNASSPLITKTATGGSMAAYLTTAEAETIRSWIVDNNAAQASTANLLTATIESGVLSLSWSAVAGASTYNMYVGTTSGTYGSNPISLGASTSKTFNLSNVAAGTYYIKIAAVSAAGVEISSLTEKSVTLLETPTNFTSSISGNTLALSWSSVQNPTGYKLNYGSSYGFWTGSVNLGNVTSYNLNVASVPAGTYYLGISAYNSDGSTAISNISSVVVGGN
jgi:mono/diheme cytochrome c family protein